MKTLDKNTSKLNEDYMSFNKISYGYKLNPKWAFENWMSEPTTLEYIQLWEGMHNPDFNNEKYLDLCTDALSKGSAPSIYELSSKANLKSMFFDKKDDGNIFLHKDLALDFASWASPAFRAYCLLNLQKKKEQAMSFKSEEDFIVSGETLAQKNKDLAFKEYISEIKQNIINFDYFSKEI